ncbi:MAG: reprolysin-like metallopeptidase [Ilumatobacter sp.]
MTRRRLLGFALVIALAALFGPGAEAFQRPGEGPTWSDPQASPDGQSVSVQLDVDAIRSQLATAPVERARGVAPPTGAVVVLPDREGGPLRVRLHEAPVLDAELTEQFPEIRSYAGTIEGEDTSRVRASVTPAGVAAIITDSTGVDTVILPMSDGRHRSGPPSPRLHEIIDAEPPLAPPTDADARRAGVASLTEPTNGTNLRVYRTAVATTGEFTQLYGGGTVGGSLAAINALFTFVNPVFERDLAVRFEIIAESADIIYTDAATDPFNNATSGAQLNVNQANTDAVIGDANYDVGHLMTTTPSGLAQLFSAGVTGSKARGMSGSPFGNLENLAIELVAHELGHQFGADHSFNGTAGFCANNRRDRAAVEPGSGTTIMSYTGICGDDDVQFNSDRYFHTFNIEQMLSHIDGPDAVPPQPTGNALPTADAGPDGAIPTDTPYALVGAGSDNDGDTLTFSWEQVDTGTGAELQDPDFVDGPLIRSFEPTTSATRFVPRLEMLAAGTSQPNVGCGDPDPACWAESLPNQARTMTMQLTVRDNQLGAGAIATEEMTVTVVDTGAAFAVTSQAAPTTAASSGDLTVTWDVAGTTAPPIAATAVDILLSTDGGLTFPITLASEVSNDGSHVVTLPDIATDEARIMVIRSETGPGVRFFSISQADLMIARADLTVLPVACPVFDSRAASGALTTSPLDGGDSVELQVAGPLPAGQGIGPSNCVPDDATAAVFTVVAVDPVAEGNLRLSPAGTAATGGVVNFAPNGLDNTNTVTVPLGQGDAEGRIRLEVNGGPAGLGAPSADVRLVVQGYYAPGAGWRYNPVVPCTVADSRSNQGATRSFVGPWGAGQGPPPVDVTGVIPSAQGGADAGTDCGVPTSAEGVVVNLVAINSADGIGHLAAGPGDASPAEYVTSFASLDRNNAAVAYLPLAADGTINVDIFAKTGTPTTNVRVVVLGYLDASAGLTFTPIVACSAFDSRSGQGSTGGFAGLRSAASTTTYDVTVVIPSAQGGAGAGTDCGIPADAEAVLINLVGVNTVGAGNLRISASETQATGGVLNFRDLSPATNNSNAVPVPISSGGELDVFVNSNVADGTPLTNVRGVLLGFYS